MTETETVKLGFDYLKSYTGIAKICQEVASLAGLISVATAFPTPRGDAFIACSAIALIFTAIIIIFHVASIIPKIGLPWNKVELVWSLFCVLFYIIVSSLILSYKFLTSYLVGGVFGIVAVILYVLDTVLIFKL